MEKRIHGRRHKIGIVTGILLAVVLAILAVRIFLPWCRQIAALDSNPDAMFPSMIYMLINSRKLWLAGTWGTLSVSLLGTLIGFVLSIPLVFLRTNTADKRDAVLLRGLKRFGTGFERVYVTLIRGTPMMVQACIVYYGGFMITRAAMPNASITEVNRAWSFFTAALITVSLNSAAYLAEVLRGGIESLDRGQSEAAASLGFSRWQAMIRVIFPQAVRNSLPSIGNELINNIKGTSVLNIIGFVELMFATGSVAGFYYKYLANYLIAAAIYLILTLGMTWLLNLVMRKTGILVGENG
jgi:putative lysine transport system permease protein